MIQKVLTKYGVAWHLAFLGAWAVFSLFTRGGGQGAAPAWLTLIAFELALLMPTVLRDETFYEARRRSLDALLWDPLFYVGLAFLALTLIQACNGGCKLEYHADADIWRMGDPAVPWLPFAVHGIDALRWAGVLAAVFGAAVIIRRALGRSAKRRLLLLLASAAGAAGYWFSFRILFAPDVPEAFWDSSAARAAGFCFAFWAIVSLGVFFDHSMDRRRGAFPFFLLGAAGSLAGTLVFASPVMTVVCLLLFLVLFVSLSVLSKGRVPTSARVKCAAALIFLAAGCAVLFGRLLPDNPVMRKTAQLSDWAGRAEAFAAVSRPRADAALDIFRGHPWFGVGAGGFGEFVGLSVADDAGWAAFRRDQSSVMNDYLQLLAEGGIVGAALALFAAVALAVPVAARLRVFARTHRGQEVEASVTLSPVVVSGLAAILLAAVDAGLESLFRAPALLLSVGIVAAALPAFLPAREAGGRGRGGIIGKPGENRPPQEAKGAFT